MLTKTISYYFDRVFSMGLSEDQRYDSLKDMIRLHSTDPELVDTKLYRIFNSNLSDEFIFKALDYLISFASTPSILLKLVKDSDISYQQRRSACNRLCSKASSSYLYDNIIKGFSVDQDLKEIAVSEICKSSDIDYQLKIFKDVYQEDSWREMALISISKSRGNQDFLYRVISDAYMPDSWRLTALTGLFNYNYNSSTAFKLLDNSSLPDNYKEKVVQAICSSGHIDDFRKILKINYAPESWAKMAIDAILRSGTNSLADEVYRIVTNSYLSDSVREYGVRALCRGGTYEYKYVQRIAENSSIPDNLRNIARSALNRY